MDSEIGSRFKKTQAEKLVTVYIQLEHMLCLSPRFCLLLSFLTFAPGRTPAEAGSRCFKGKV